MLLLFFIFFILYLCFVSLLAFPGSDHLLIGERFEVSVVQTKEKENKENINEKKNIQKFVEGVSAINQTLVFSEEESPTRALDNLMSVILPIYFSACTIKVMKMKKQEPRKPDIASKILKERKLITEPYQ